MVKDCTVFGLERKRKLFPKNWKLKQEIEKKKYWNNGFSFKLCVYIRLYTYNSYIVMVA